MCDVNSKIMTSIQNLWRHCTFSSRGWKIGKIDDDKVKSEWVNESTC